MMDRTNTYSNIQAISLPSLGLILILLAFGTDLFTPLLIWKGIIPAQLRWISHAAVMTMIFLLFIRMMAFDHIPKATLLIVGISLIGILSALYHGQGIVPSLWGWWLIFQFPLVGLFAYLEPNWPEHYPQILMTSGVVILGLIVLVQIAQYLTGVPPGDQLAGTLGKHGTGDLVIFILLLLSFALGRWLTQREWKTLLITLALSIVSSLLGEMKLFLLGVVLLGGLAVLIFLLQGKEIWKLIPYTVMVSVIASLFFVAYNIVIPGAKRVPLQTYLESPDVLMQYLQRSEKRVSNGQVYYDLGRNYATSLGWKAIQSDRLIFLFGMGLGARGESKTLNTAGIGLVQGSLGMTSGTSLLVIMQETGVLGLLSLAGFVLWISFKLLQDIRINQHSEATELRWGLILFSILWPVWLWYNQAWTLRVPMLLYWTTMGFVLSEARGIILKLKNFQLHSDKLSTQ